MYSVQITVNNFTSLLVHNDRVEFSRSYAYKLARDFRAKNQNSTAKVISNELETVNENATTETKRVYIVNRSNETYFQLDHKSDFILDKKDFIIFEDFDKFASYILNCYADEDDCMTKEEVKEYAYKITELSQNSYALQHTHFMYASRYDSLEIALDFCF